MPPKAHRGAAESNAPARESAFIFQLRAELAATRRRDAREAWALVLVGAAVLGLYLVIGHGGLLPVGVGAIALAALLGSFLWWLGGRSTALNTLSVREADVVWVFARVGAASARQASLVFCFFDRVTLEVAVRPSTSDAWVELASASFPTATIGYSAEAQRGFDADPRTLRTPPRDEALRVRAPERDTAWLVPYARAALRPGRSLLVWLGAVLGAVGVLGLVLVLAAASGTERAWLAGIFGCALVFGVALAAWGARPFEGTTLYRALTSGDGLAEVRLVDGPDGSGRVVPMAMVTLTSGRRYTFPTRPLEAA